MLGNTERPEELCMYQITKVVLVNSARHTTSCIHKAKLHN